jgi:endonuclease IV
MAKICFATGSIWRLINKYDIFEIISELDVDGVEYTYGKHFNDRKLKEKDFDLLNNYSFVSMHSPFKLSLDLTSKKEFDKTINLIKKDYKKMNAKHIVFHPTTKLPKKIPKMNYVIENLNQKKGDNRPRLGFEKVLKNKEWGLCLDVSHSFDWGETETERIVKKWKKRIKSVHFSNNRYHKDHLTFEKVSKLFLKSIEPIKELNVPIVIEEDMPYTKISEIKKEIKRVREIIE